MNSLPLKRSAFAVASALFVGTFAAHSPTVIAADVAANVSSYNTSSASLSEVDQLALQLSQDNLDKFRRSAQADNLTLLQKALPFAQDIQANGSWADINYADTQAFGWSPADHLVRMRWMAMAFADANAQTQTSADYQLLKTSVQNAVQYWIDRKPTSTNWWWRDIGPQLHFGPVGLAMRQHLSTSQLNYIGSLMPQEFDPKKDTGANLTDKALSIATGALISGDETKLKFAIDAVKQTALTTDGDGLQKDHSYLIHGPQLYSGTYGQVQLSTVLKLAYLTRNMSYAFNQTQLNAIAEHVLDGDQWMTRGGVMDHHTMGRGIARVQDDVIDNTAKLEQLDQLRELVPARASEIALFRAHLTGGKAGINGFKHFWRSDYSASQRPDFLFTVKMASNRVTTQETSKKENLLGYWLTHGSTTLMLDGDEYRNIYPVWDWRFIPGVTAPEWQGMSAPWGVREHNQPFVGGVSDGQSGVTAMDFRARGTRAKKAWFHFDNEVVALGADISSSSNQPVTTTVNQALLDGSVEVQGSGILPLGSRSIAKTQAGGAGWVHHDNVGYVFPQDWQGVLSNQSQTGNWFKINNTKSEYKTPVSKDVFNLRIDHGLKPQNASYQYVMYPGKTAQETSNYSANLPLKVLANTATVQAVHHRLENKVGVVFHQAGSVTLSNGKQLSASKPSVVLLDQSQAVDVLSVSTPSLAGGTLEVCLGDGNGYGQKQSISMPSGAEQGKGVTVEFNGVYSQCNFTAPTAKTVINPTDDSFIRGGSYKSSIYGNWGSLAVKQTANETWTRHSYLRWDLDQLNATQVRKATVRLHVSIFKDAPSAQLAFHKAGDAWHEGDMKWWFPGTNMGWRMGTATVNQSGQWVEFDVTSFVNAELSGDKLMSIGLKSETNNAWISITSSEASTNKPELVVQY